MEENYTISIPYVTNETELFPPRTGGEYFPPITGYEEVECAEKDILGIFLMTLLCFVAFVLFICCISGIVQDIFYSSCKFKQRRNDDINIEMGTI